MNVIRMMGLLCLSGLLGGCGGGGGDSGRGAAAAVPASPAAVQVSISSPAIAETVAVGDDFRARLSGGWNGSNLGTAQVFLQVSDSGNTFVLPAIELAPGSNTFTYTLPWAADLAEGQRTGKLSIRACRDVRCAQTYADATASIDYQLQIARIAEWETYQRNPSHDGYVPITLDPTRFATAWEWWRPIPGNCKVGIHSVVTSNGSVYVSSGNQNCGTVHALSEAAGTQRWTVSLPWNTVVNPPAVSEGRLYVATMDYDKTFLWSFDAADGVLKFKSQFGAQGTTTVLAPTVYAANVYTNGGYEGGTIYAFDRLTGGAQWDRQKGRLVGTTPAVDEDHVYFHSGLHLEIWNRVTGDVVASVPDPSADIHAYPGTTAPMLGGRGNVIAVSSSGTAKTRKLSSFNIASRQWEWSTENSYLMAAVANGVIYATRNDPASLDAIDEVTGKVLWSWQPPDADAYTGFFSNIVATRNLLFVSTSQWIGPTMTWALDLATKQVVWRYSGGGRLAISANRTLYIAPATPAMGSDGRLVAVKLR